MMHLKWRDGGGILAPVKASKTPKGRSGGGRDSMPIPDGNGSVASGATDFGERSRLKRRPNRLDELLK